QRLSQSSSAPSRDPGLQLLEVPPVGPSVFPSTCVCQSTSVPSSDYSSGVSPAISKCSQLLPRPIAIVDINRPLIRNSKHYGDVIHAPNADTSSNWQSGSGACLNSFSIECMTPRVVFGLALIFAGLRFIGKFRWATAIKWSGQPDFKRMGKQRCIHWLVDMLAGKSWIVKCYGYVAVRVSKTQWSLHLRCT
ncbi:hypothetical protein Tco_1224354, partial [Tanacetum coccineum]